MKARNDSATTARSPPSHGSLMVFSSTSRTSMSTMLGLRPQEPLSCLDRRMDRRRDVIELRIWKGIDGCSWLTPADAAYLCRRLLRVRGPALERSAYAIRRAERRNYLPL